LNHEDREEVRRTQLEWPFDWPLKAACRDVRRCKYKPPIAPVRFVFAASDIAAVGARRAPTNRTATLRSSPFLRLLL
jgi:hypothetical protein